MTKIFYESQISWLGKKTPENIATLIDSGSSNCYIDEKLAEYFGWRKQKLPPSRVGLGGKIRKRFGPFFPTFTIRFKGRKYEAKAKTYITPLEGLGVIISGNFIKKTKLPIQKIIEFEDSYEL